jgi:hypothetical protein
MALLITRKWLQTKKFIKECIILLHTMKKKLSITIEEEKIVHIENYVKSGYFRNKSHLIEFAIEKFLRDDRK